MNIRATDCHTNNSKQDLVLPHAFLEYVDMKLRGRKSLIHTVFEV